MILLWSIESELAYEHGNNPTPYLLSMLSSYDGDKHIIKPTMFPDKTSQVWKLPEDLFKINRAYVIDWRFEEEREFFDLANLVALINQSTYDSKIHLHVPYFPYARQDKHISNTTTFALKPFLHFLSMLRLNSITMVDVHNEDAALSMRSKSILNTPVKMINLSVEHIHRNLIEDIKPNLLVFPDEGAAKRYSVGKDKIFYFYVHDFVLRVPTIACRKKRDQETGNIIGHELLGEVNLQPNSNVLLLDDLCDGGATFISVAKALRAIEPNITIHLFTTHGIYSKGREHLLDNGIDHVYCTNSYGVGEFRV
jgi:ribose-phosphate pyrophosphokinase